jgi:hypothetical protein
MNLAHDDDGIIDLRALKSTPPPRGAYPMASPFGSEPPPAAFARDAGADSGMAGVGPAPASRAKTIGIAAGVAAFLIVGAVGVGFAFRFRGEKPAKLSAASVTQPAPPAAVVAPPPPAAAADPAPAAQPAADDDASDAPPPKKTKGGKGRAAASKAKTFSGAGAGAATTGASKPAVTKAADPCHCHGDFQCNIRCSANR